MEASGVLVGVPYGEPDCKDVRVVCLLCDYPIVLMPRGGTKLQLSRVRVCRREGFRGFDSDVLSGIGVDFGANDGLDRVQEHRRR